MKILFLANELNNSNGVSSHLYNLCLGLKQYDAKIDIVCGQGDVIKKFEDIGINVFIIPQLLHEKRGMWNFISAHIKLLAVLYKGKYDIVHSHHHYCANIASNICRFLSIKTVQTNHGILPDIGKLNHFAGEYLIAVNDHIYDKFLGDKITSHKKLFLIYNGAVEYKKQERTKGKIKFIAASRLVEEKGIQDFILAVYTLENKYLEKAEFYFAGEGLYEHELLILNREKGNLITFLGNIENLSNRFWEYDVLVMTSKSLSEGLPMTMIEAAFAGCIILSSNFWGLNKFISDTKGCLIYKCGDYQGLAGKIKYIIDNYEIVNNAADQFRKIVKEYFSSELMTRKTFDVYTQILNGK